MLEFQIIKTQRLCGEKVVEFVERSKMWSSVETSTDNAENMMMGVSDEELYNLPTAEFVHRRGGFLNRQFTAYHTAFYACAELQKVEVFAFMPVFIFMYRINASYIFFHLCLFMCDVRSFNKMVRDAELSYQHKP